MLGCAQREDGLSSLARLLGYDRGAADAPLQPPRRRNRVTDPNSTPRAARESVADFERIETASRARDARARARAPEARRDRYGSRQLLPLLRQDLPGADRDAARHLPGGSDRARWARGAAAARPHLRRAGDPQDLPRRRVRPVHPESRRRLPLREPVRHDDQRAAAGLSLDRSRGAGRATLRCEAAEGRAALGLVRAPAPRQPAHLRSRRRRTSLGARGEARARSAESGAPRMGAGGVRGAHAAQLAGARLRSARLPAHQGRARDERGEPRRAARALSRARSRGRARSTARPSRCSPTARCSRSPRRGRAASPSSPR